MVVVTQQLADWIKTAEAKGFTQEQIFNELVQHGYSPDSAKQALEDTTLGPVDSSSQGTRQEATNQVLAKKSSYMMILIIVVLTLLVGAAANYYFTLRDVSQDSEEMISNQAQDQEAVLIIETINENESTQLVSADQAASDELEVPQDSAPVEGGCASFAKNLDSCTVYSCVFMHPLSGESMKRTIVGLQDGLCLYVEEMPNNGHMDCRFSEISRKTYAKYLGVGDNESHPPDLLGSGECVILGYEQPECPEGTEYRGETYDENGTAMVVCSNPNMVCPACENCASGIEMKVLMAGGNQSGEEVCMECQFDSHCKTGFECVDYFCFG